MRKLIYLIFALFAVACGSKPQTAEISAISPKNSLFVVEFYGTYLQSKLGNDSVAIQDSIRQEAKSLDSCYLIHYKQLIDGYDIRIKVDSVGEFNGEFNDDIICHGNLIVSNEDKAISISTFPICLPDSLFNQLQKYQINELDYDCKKKAYYWDEQLKYPHLGEYRDMPFFFFDADFDGENELMMRLAGIGQRFRDCYCPLKLNWETYDFEEANITDNDAIKENCLYPPLDDMTQFDFANKTFILHMSSGGWWANEWHYYKVENGESRFVKKIVEYFREIPEVKRIIFQDNDPTVTNIPVGKACSYSID